MVMPVPVALSPFVNVSPSDEMRPVPANPATSTSPWRSVGRGIGRFFRVQATLVWFALAWLADRVGLRRLYAIVRGRGASHTPLTGPIALRLAFESLGPTFIKLGQLVASGDGLFPLRYSEEFRRCLDRVPPFAWPDVERTVREELGAGPDQAFAAFETKSFAAASIAQVHYATRHDGQRVVVKVQRPGIEPLIRADLLVMRANARVLSWLPRVHLANPVGIVEDLEKTLLEELDFRGEARNMDEFSAIMVHADNARVVAPHVFWDQTGARLLTMERFEGWRVDDVETLKAGPHDPERCLIDGIRGWFQGLIYRGFFHGDVHAGNFMVLEDGRVGFLDFGIVGRFDEARRSQITEYVLAFQQRDFRRLAEVLVAMGSVGDRKVDMDRFTGQLEKVFDPMVNPEEGFALRHIVPGMLRVALEHHMRMPREFVLVTKQLVYLDRYAKAYGGAQMNVLTDLRVMQHILEDLQAAAMKPMRVGAA